MTDDRIPMTREGYERKKAELDRMQGVEMIELTKRVAAARDLGDLSENAEYHAAREMQGFIEGRIQELEYTLSHAEVIDVARLNAGTRVVFGAIVDLADEDSGEEISYQIVGDLEADIKQQLISVSSPFARALIGKNAGDSFEFKAPNGTRNYEITGVRYES